MLPPGGHLEQDFPWPGGLGRDLIRGGRKNGGKEEEFERNWKIHCNWNEEFKNNIFVKFSFFRNG